MLSDKESQLTEVLIDISSADEESLLKSEYKATQKDNRAKAIFAMNLVSILGIGQNVAFKKSAEQGVSFIDY